MNIKTNTFDWEKFDKQLVKMIKWTEKNGNKRERKIKNSKKLV